VPAAIIVRESQLFAAQGRAPDQHRSLRMAHGGTLVLIIFVILLSASGLGMYLHGRLGERHRTSETVDHVRLVVSILVTFTALVLSLLLSEVKGTFDTFDARLRAFAGDLSNLDIHLREYGADAEPIRATLRKYVAAAIADSWQDEPSPSGDYPRFEPTSGVERQQLGALLVQVDYAIHKLDPPDHFRQRLADSLANQIDEALHARRRRCQTKFLAASLAVVASGHEEPVPLFQQLPRSDSPGRDDVRAVPAVAAQR
jgi:hypothetical protein